MASEQALAQRFQDYYMDIAKRSAQMSRAVRLQVGAVAVKDGRILSTSWNGTPAGMDNTCENKVFYNDTMGKFNVSEFPYLENVLSSSNAYVPYKLVTKPEVLHAEENVILKMARDGESAKDATIFVTHAPCFNCARMVYGAGFRRLIYDQTYRDDSGLQFLQNLGVDVVKYRKED